MIGVDPQVFVHVERGHSRPVDVVGRDQSGQKLVLARRGREHDVGHSLGTLPRPDRLHDAVRGRPPRQRSILVDKHLEAVFSKSSDRWQIGVTHGDGSSREKLAEVGHHRFRIRVRSSESCEEPYRNFARVATGSLTASGSRGDSRRDQAAAAHARGRRGTPHTAFGTR